MTPTFTGELQLAGWSESHTGGCKVTFWLQSPDELAAFRALTVRKGNTAGHRFMAALVEIGDDELPVEPETGIPVTAKESIGDACRRAVMWCKEPQFWVFLNFHPNFASADHVSSAQEAADLVKHVCTVNSRRELDTDNEANKTWHREIREPYRLWLLTQNGQAA